MNLLRNQRFLIGAIFILALLLRLYRLGEFPVGFHVDEARAGWNAYSILKTGLDDRGNRLALYYNTFGDYRPTAIFYTIIPSLILFGRTEFAVRFPAALFGALTIPILYFFALELTKKRPLALVSALLLAVSPWHINVSRATSESVIAVFFGLTGVYFLLRFVHSEKRSQVVTAGGCLAVSYLFYHSARIVVPLLVGGLVVYSWQVLHGQTKRIVIAVCVLFTVLTLGLATDRQARGRFSQVSIFNDLTVKYELSKMPFEEGPGRVFVARLFHNKILVYSRRFITEYTRYFSPDFLISQQANPVRYMTVGMGLLTYIEFLLLVAGLVALARGKYPLLPLVLLLIAPLPAGLTTEDAPNLQRALFMIPLVAIIGAYGYDFLRRQNRWGSLVRLGLPLALAANLLFYFHMYYVHAKVHLPLYRNVGAKELALELSRLQQNYVKIILTDIPDDPYPWLAFFGGRDPKQFNKDAVLREHGVWTTENFVFTGLRCPSRDAFERPDVARLLVVDAEGCASESNLRARTDVKLLTRITRPDGTEAYNLWSMGVP